MTLKLVPVVGSVVVGAIDVAEEHYEVDPLYKHLTRVGGLGIGVILSLVTEEKTLLNDLGEGLVYSEIPLLCHSAYDVARGAMAGGKRFTKEEIELRLRRRGAGRVRYV